MVDFLKDHLKDIPPEEWHLHWLCYDNVCNVVSINYLETDQFLSYFLNFLGPAQISAETAS